MRPISPNVLLLCISLALSAGTAPAQATELSEHGSFAGSAEVVGSVVQGSIELPIALVELSVAGVEVSTGGAIWLLRGIAEGSGHAVELSIYVAGGASMIVGTTLQVVTSGAGVLLIASGEAVAFIPNELGASLYHSTTFPADQEDVP